MVVKFTCFRDAVLNFILNILARTLLLEPASFLPTIEYRDNVIAQLAGLYYGFGHKITHQYAQRMCDYNWF